MTTPPLNLNTVRNSVNVTRKFKDIIMINRARRGPRTNIRGGVSTLGNRKLLRFNRRSHHSHLNFSRTI